MPIPELSSPIVLPPSSPGYSQGSNSGVIAISAATFIAGARSGLNSYSDPAAPGPAQVQDDQTAANGTAASDTVVIDLDTVGAVTGVKYLIFVGYLVLDTGSIAAQLALVDHAGTVFVRDSIDGGEILFVSGGPYAMVSPYDSTGDRGLVLKTGAGQTLKLRAFHTSGSGSVVLDCVFLLPDPTTTYASGVWSELYGGESGSTTYTVQFDGWVPPGYGGVSPPYGYNGMFPCIDGAAQVGDSGLTAAPTVDGSKDFDYGGNGRLTGYSGTSYRAFTFARCTDPTKDVGRLRMITGTYPGAAGATHYSVPADGSVYLMNMDADSFFDPDSDYYALQAWVDVSGQHVRVGEGYYNVVDPPYVPPVGPLLNLRFRAAT